MSKNHATQDDDSVPVALAAASKRTCPTGADEHAAEFIRSLETRSQGRSQSASLAGTADWAHRQNGHDARVNPQVLSQIFGQYEGSVFQEQSDLSGGAFDQYMARKHKDVNPSRDVQTPIACEQRLPFVLDFLVPGDGRP